MTALKSRKTTRLKVVDYDCNHVIFLTICTKDRRCTLSSVVGTGVLDGPQMELSQYGKIADKYINQLNDFYENLSVESYVIMPNHIHMVLFLEEDAAGDSRRPTLMDVVCAYKSLTTRACKKEQPIEKLFQTSFYEHVIRNRNDYLEIAEYILENPCKWELDKLYSKE